MVGERLNRSQMLQSRVHRWSCRFLCRLPGSEPLLHLLESEGGEDGRMQRNTARDLWPGGRLITPVTGPDVLLAFGPPTQLISMLYTHTNTHTVWTFAL